MFVLPGRHSGHHRNMTESEKFIEDAFMTGIVVIMAIILVYLLVAPLACHLWSRAREKKRENHYKIANTTDTLA